MEPDYAFIDRLVKEYTEFRDESRASPDQQLGDDIVDRIMKAFDCGDYPTILTLWDSYVAQKLHPDEDAALQDDADVAEFYMHLHCATCPFRQSIMKSMGSPAAAAQLAARSMTIFKHFIESKGKHLFRSHAEFQVSIRN